MSTPPPPREPDLVAEVSKLPVKTPKSSKEVLQLQRDLSKIDPIFGNATGRLIFRKTAKALDASTLESSLMEQHNEQLTVSIEKTKPKKRRKVLPAPNEEFVRLKDVQLVKGGLEGPPRRSTRNTRLKVVEIKEESEGYSDDDCIFVAPVQV